MQGKVVVVTGAGRGLGKVLSETFHGLGATVLMVGRNREKIEEAAKSVGERAHAYVADVGEWDSVEACFSEIAKEHPSIDVLVNNAALTNPAKTEKAQIAYIDAMVTTNLLGTIYCCRAALPLLKEGEGGDIVNLSSQSVTTPVPTLATYMASKAGVEAFSRSLRMEVRPDNVRVGVLRVGTMTWNPDDVQAKMAGNPEPEGGADFMELCQREGTMSLLNPGMDMASAAQMVVQMVSLPRDAVIDIVELIPTKRT